ncbi:MAG: hypothetical protein PHE49_10355 [bacterium]|nr:hypothetical protein [bacterium]
MNKLFLCLVGIILTIPPYIIKASPLIDNVGSDRAVIKTELTENTTEAGVQKEDKRFLFTRERGFFCEGGLRYDILMGDITLSAGYGVDLGIGYSFSKRFSLCTRFFFDSFHESKERIWIGNIDKGFNEFLFGGMTLNGKILFLKPTRLQPFASVGGGFYGLAGDAKNGFVARSMNISGGINYYINQSFVLVGEFMYHNTDYTLATCNGYPHLLNTPLNEKTLSPFLSIIYYF